MAKTSYEYMNDVEKLLGYFGVGPIKVYATLALALIAVIKEGIEKKGVGT